MGNPRSLDDAQHLWQHSAVVIFTLSSIPSISTGLGTWDTILRKGAHLAEYAVLGGLLYRALAEGTMAVVSPVAAATSAAIPVVVDLATGGELSTLAAVGIAVALIAIMTVARERSHTKLSPRLLIMAIAAGAGFGSFFIAIAQTAEASGFWPLVGARAVTIPLGFLLHRILEPPARPRGVTLRWVAGAGLLDMGANLLVAAALQRGPLGIVSVLTSLYPAVTAMIAVAVLRERLSRTQVVGVGLATIAIVMLVL